MVTEHMDEVILGLSWLQEQEAVWDFQTAQLTIGGETHFLFDGVDAPVCHILMQKSVTIPARSQMNISIKTGYSNLKAT